MKLIFIWRRQGLYRQLYEKVKLLAEEKGDICGFRLYVETENQIAQKTYEKLGMQKTHYYMYEELNPELEFFK